MSKKILLIGKNGFLGAVLERNAPLNFEIVGLGREDFDIGDYQKTLMVLEREKPEIVINTAAIAKTEECEKDPETAFLVNALGALNLAKASSLVGATMVEISTDYVFDGEKGVYTEVDRPQPINAYGISKYAGELAVSAYSPRHYIIRSSSLYGQSPKKKVDFPSLMIKLAGEGKDIVVVDDIFMSPTNINSLAKKIFELIEKKAPFGIYHVAGAGACSWYELAKKTFEIMKLDYEIKPIKASQQNVLTKRPKHIELKSDKLSQAGIEPMRPWADDLGKYLRAKFNV